MRRNVPVHIIEAIKANDSATIVELFVNNPDQKTFVTPFGSESWIGYAAQVGKLAAIEALIESGVDLMQADAHDGALPICSAASAGHVDIVRYLLKVGIELDVSESVRNPLFSAIVGRSPEIVTLLLEAGIDSTARYNSPSMEDMDAVAFALMRGESKCASIIALWNANGDEKAAEKTLVEADEIATKNVS